MSLTQIYIKHGFNPFIKLFINEIKSFYHIAMHRGLTHAKFLCRIPYGRARSCDILAFAQNPFYYARLQIKNSVCIFYALRKFLLRKV